MFITDILFNCNSIKYAKMKKRLRLGITYIQVFIMKLKLV